MNLKTKIIEYKFEDFNEELDLNVRTVTIIFIKDKIGKDMIDALWQFAECKYGGLSEIYTEEDWDFLKEVADKIKELKKKLNK